MDQETIKTLIQKYKQQVEALNVVIRQLEAELADPQAHGASTVQAGSPSSASKQKPAAPVDPLSVVREWQFFNKSQPDAAEQLLELVGHPLSTQALVEGMEKGGLKIGGDTMADKKQNLASVLPRSGKFGKAARGTWGLSNWPNIEPVMKRGAKENGQENEKDESGKEAAGE